MIANHDPCLISVITNPDSSLISAIVNPDPGLSLTHWLSIKTQ